MPQTWNRYIYVVNNPLGLIDPTGAADEWAEKYYTNYVAGFDKNSADYANAMQLQKSDITYVLSVKGLEGKKEGEIGFDGQNVLLYLDSGGPMEEASMNSRLALPPRHARR